jgi:hypothetical protein
MNAKQALALKQSRETTLVELDELLPEGRRSGELSGLVATAKQLHKLLTRYDSMETRPAIAETFDKSFTACVDRISELAAATEK